jgi:CBS domain-containing protein
MPNTTPVRDVMSSNVVTLRPDQSVADAADVLAADKIGAAPVVDAEGNLVGLLRDEDLILSEANVHVPTAISFLGADFVLPSALHRFEADLKKAAGAAVGDVMGTEFATVTPGDTLEQLATLMHDRDVTHVPVVDGGKLVGIVARGDLVRFLAATT